MSGIALGGIAIGSQLFTGTIMLIVGGLIATAIIYAPRDAFGEIFGGLFDG
ncbi:hypothetical protein [Thioclava pacifica]|uniref:Uncharacterized protein n=1 Tax=Thioclava pacifica DSM 10166 TaxID=1353537 RepID=A0A074JKI0_9RHOB|nr:hypothetical protein [Thioclava pacifica]KEO56088.1 hypothetical protein TP2_00785 [Thioclava pacifica DSM 10166]